MLAIYAVIMGDESRRLPNVILWLSSTILLCGFCFWLGRLSSSSPIQIVASTYPKTDLPPSPVEPTTVYAHNLLLRKGSHFRIYVRWLRGRMLRTEPARNPSFDNPDSFVLELDKGVIDVKLADIANFLNYDTSSKAPVRNISISYEGGQFHLHGTVHKMVPIPVTLDGVLIPLPDGRLKYHVTKLNVLKIPVKGLLGLFHTDLSSLASKFQTPGVQIVDNDIFFDTQRLLPPPHIHGRITSVEATSTELTVIYGAARNDEENLIRWHNFLRLTGGSLDFGKLTMRDVDFTMIDASKDPWFDLDLVNYQAQLVYGTTRMTEHAGLEIYMPDLDKLPPKKPNQGVTTEWLKNRDAPPPVVTPAK